MTEITFPSDTRSAINAMRSAIGRPVLFYSPTITECTACSEDPVTHTSTNPYCTTCSGIHFISVYNPVTITGHITWGASETLAWSVGGQYLEGDVRVQIEHTAGNISILDTTDYIELDGKRFRIDHKTYRGVPTLNRIILDCSMDE
jgi:hypothetical protein